MRKGDAGRCDLLPVLRRASERKPHSTAAQLPATTTTLLPAATTTLLSAAAATPAASTTPTGSTASETPPVEQTRNDWSYAVHFRFDLFLYSSFMVFGTGFFNRWTVQEA